MWLSFIMPIFKLYSPFKPTGDQPKAIDELVSSHDSLRTLMGVTGSGKTFTIANVIAQQKKPVIIMSPNKTLAAQLYEEFSLFFPENKICYFVSYYDYYKPESYIPSQDLYFPKETRINAEIERLRIEAAASAINRPDTIIIASVSCIYSLGNPEDFKNLALSLHINQQIKQRDVLKKLIEIQYIRNDIEHVFGTFWVRPEMIDITLPYQRDRLRIEFSDDKIERLSWLHRETNKEVSSLDNTIVFPARHFVTTEEKKKLAVTSIQKELDWWLPELKNPIYEERLTKRIGHDIELIKHTGICQGIENYSAHFEKREKGIPPYALFDFFKDFLFVIDESHLAIPQLRAMYIGDQARKQTLVDYGFRLPSAKDNRPLKFDEIEKYFKDVIFVSATPGEYEIRHSKKIAEQIIRPTGIPDPVIIIRPRINQLDNLKEEIETTTKAGFRTLVTVLTKRLAEELAEYLENKGIKVCYLHHDLKTPERTQILYKLRTGVFDCLVGINLLREGLDLPEVALVAIMDADIEGFLRDKRSLIQTIGRAARNKESKVIMYADKITESMREAIDETARRRQIQIEFNKKHGIEAKSTTRTVGKSITTLGKLYEEKSEGKRKNKKTTDVQKYLAHLELEMEKAAQELNFEKAIQLRNEWLEAKKRFQEE
jgi:excinuclease ABC subunit B